MTRVETVIVLLPNKSKEPNLCKVHEEGRSCCINFNVNFSKQGQS
jgi:hypothetical protein